MRPSAASALLLVLTVAPLGCAGDDDTSMSTNTVEVVVTDRATGEPAAQAEADRASRIKSHIDSSDVVRLFPPTVVLDGDIREHRRGTPERALLEWWQAFQFSDARTVISHTSQDTIENCGNTANHAVKFGKLAVAYMAEVAKGGFVSGLAEDAAAAR